MNLYYGSYAASAPLWSIQVPGYIARTLIDDRLFQEDASHTEAAGVRFFAAGPLDVELGGHLAETTVAYQVFGELNPARDNAILVCHAISGDSNAIGWWSRIVGPGLALDTDRYAIICSNVLGGCQGSTGPASLNPGTGRPYGSAFPEITVGDMVTLQQRLISGLGIERLTMVCGGSMGGMQALEWGRRSGAKRVWSTASSAQHNAMQIGYNEVARQAIFADPEFRGGDYYDGPGPRAGLAVGRMLGHLSYLSVEAFDAKFGRRRQADDPETFQIESYLRYQGRKFTDRFDANSLIALSRAIDRYKCRSLAGSNSKFLFTGFTTDQLYLPSQSFEAHQMAIASGCDSRFELIQTPAGHDAFLLDDGDQARFVREFLSGRTGI